MSLLTRRRVATTTAALIAAAPLLVLTPTTASAASDEPCAPDEGVTVVVDFTDIGGDLETRCAPGDPVSGRQALEAAGFAPDDNAFFCTIDAHPDPCDYASTGAFWSYWYATPEQTWDFHTAGADDADPAPGDVEGWRYNDGSAGPTGGPPAPGPDEPLPQGPTEPVTLAEAAAWLADPDQLVDGDHVELGGQPRYDLTSDVALGLLAAGTQDDTLDAVLDFLETGAEDYAHGAEFDGEREDAVYAGAAAKLGLVALLTGGDPRSVGGLNLVADLEGIETAEGRYVDRTAFGDVSNVFTQSLALLLLAEAPGVDPSTAAVTRLEAQQCDDGGFPVYIDPESCASDADATGLALQALTALGSDAAGAATSYLAATRQADGSWTSSTPGASGANVNSTAYAAMGLWSAGVDTSQTAQWLASVANPDHGLPVVPGAESDTFATAQALPALASTNFAASARAVPRPVESPDPDVPADPTEPTSPTEPIGPTAPVEPQAPGQTSGERPAPSDAAVAGSEGRGVADASTQATSARATGSLARTGTDAPQMVGAGALLVAAGGAALLAARRRRGSV